MHGLHERARWAYSDCMNAITPQAERQVGRPEFDIDAFDLITANMGYDTDAKRQRALGMSNVMSRIRAGEARPGEKFIENMVALGIPYDAVFPKRVAK